MAWSTTGKAVTLEYKTYIGEVVRLLDGEAMVVKILNAKEKPVWNLRLIGIDTDASNEAYEFVKTNTMGNVLIFKVHLNKDESLYRDNDGYYYSQVYISNKNLNGMLMTNGLAKLDKSHKDLYGYNEVANKAAYAEENGIGQFGAGDYYNPYSRKVNIQTASTTEMRDILVNTDYELANKIYKYVKYNKINIKSELKFIDPLITNDWLDVNQNKISLMTNINTAEEYELKTLFISSKEKAIVEKVVENRLKKPYTKMDKLLDIKEVTTTILDKVKPFAALEYRKNFIDEETKVVNVNTASERQLRAVEDISDSYAKKIVKYRDNYGYKTLEELKELPGGFSDLTFNKVEDSLKVWTNLNDATDYELESLFGKYNLTTSQQRIYGAKIKRYAPYETIEDVKKYIPQYIYEDIKNYVYVGEIETPMYTNINLATKSQLITNFKLSTTDANKILTYTKGRDVNYFAEINQKVDLEKYGHKITLYTNVNTATKEELMALHKDITIYIANKIIEYREERPFGNKAELGKLFSSIKKNKIYIEIEKYLVVR